jgi:hypothetical protein
MVFLQVFFFTLISAQASEQEQERCSNSSNFVFGILFSLLFFFCFTQRMLDTPQQQSQSFTCQ